MSLPRFIQIHTLHNYPAALLNRDDAGLAKRLPYGDAVRTRISSQCLKRHWRMAEDAFALRNLNVSMSVRSRELPALIKKRLIERGVSETSAQAAVEALRQGGLLDKGKELKGEAALETAQAVLMGYAEIDYLVKRCASIAQDDSDEKDIKKGVADFLKAEKKNIQALKLGSGLEAALFGRMVTSDVLASRDAAMYVAHAFTVHEAQVENDYFTVVDDLLREAGETGSAGIFDTELASGLYYGYVVVDVPQLVANLEGVAMTGWNTISPAQRELSGRVVKHLLHLIATISPGAKRGSTAPFEWAKFVMVEAGDWQPRTLAGAFQNALKLEGEGLRKRAIERLSTELRYLDEAYGVSQARRYLSVDDVEIPGAERLDLKSLADWAESIVKQACVGA
ncbi:MAG: type I-E CRISPR-associated protein Cas7/Cse4/CasC [Lautropia sp.]|nr:type I-E CRISPR-associated protein Cas7/Cse4/CasC [Lautropia sp.]